MKGSQHDKLFLFNRLIPNIKDTLKIFVNELKIISNDRGVVIIFILATLAYPLLYSTIYKNEVLINMPIAAVDNARSKESTELLRHLNATQDVEIVSTYSTLEEAKQAYDQRVVHGVIYIPKEFSQKINSGEQTTVSIYCDMSSFLYYRTLMQSSNRVILDIGKQIQLKRLNAQGITGESATIIAEPVPYQDVILFNEGGGYASFLLPAILILILQQTLFFGISILAGTSREENRFHVFVSSSVHKGGTFRVVLGKSAAYFLIYLVWSFYALRVIPNLFDLPHIGNPIDLLYFVVPFLLASIFFSMTVSVFLPNRETGMLLFSVFSLILLFLGGVSWPMSNMNGFWKVFSWIFPSTHGIQGYIKINSLGTDLQTISREYISLWVQTIVYFLTTTWVYHWQIKKSSRRYQKSLSKQARIAR
ncbi:MAG: ABC transporter permease [Rikenellaceae bacterium]